jgi:hypothetical protein
MTKPYWWDDRYGISPTISGTDLDTSTANLSKIVYNLLIRAGLFSRDEAGTVIVVQLNPTNDIRWYNVMEAGFAYIDEKCNAYFTDLDILYRQKNRLITGITQVDKAVNAVLYAAEASAKNLTIVGQAFGLAEGLAGTVADSYLYSIDPSHVSVMVVKARRAYRVSAETAQANITSFSTAYEVLQGYIEICLPPSIEAQIVSAVASTDYFPADVGPPGVVPVPPGSHQSNLTLPPAKTLAAAVGYTTTPPNNYRLVYSTKPIQSSNRGGNANKPPPNIQFGSTNKPAPITQ